MYGLNNFVRSRIGNYYFNLCIYITYLVSFLPILIFNNKTYYVYKYNKSIDILGIIIYLFFVFFFIRFIPVVSSYLKRYFLLISNKTYIMFGFLAGPYIKITFSIILIITTLIQFFMFGFGVRHMEEASISNLGILGLLSSISKFFNLIFLIFDTFILFVDRYRRSKLFNISYFFVVFSSFIAARSSMQIFLVLTVFSANISFIRNLKINLSLKNLNFKKIFSIKNIFKLLIFPSVVLATVSAAFIFKSVFYFDLVRKNIDYFYIKILLRLTTHADSLYSILNGCFDYCKRLNILESLAWKISFFFDKNFYTSTVQFQPNRINFFNTFSHEVYLKLERGGSSPGPLASFFLENTFILGFIFMSILLAFFFYGMNTIISKIDNNRANSPLIFLLYYFSYYFLLAGPLNILLLFDPTLICFLLFILYVGKYSSIKSINVS